MRTKSLLSRKVIVPVSAVLCVLLLAAAVFKYAEEIVSFKQRLYERNESQETQDTPASAVDHTFVEPRSYRGDEWFVDMPLIYHACGGIDGLDYTNSREALDQTLASAGPKALVEVDFSFTSDGRLVCVHKWADLGVDAPLDYNEFRSFKVYGKYTTLSAADILGYMERYPDLYIVVDTKEPLLDVMRELIELSAGSDVLDRFIIQLYHAGEKAQIQAMHSFPEDHYLYTVYKTGNNPEYVLGICQEENISVVTLPHSFFSDSWQVFIDNGFILYAHTVNRPDIGRALMAAGIFGLYTDFLTASDLTLP